MTSTMRAAGQPGLPHICRPGTGESRPSSALLLSSLCFLILYSDSASASVKVSHKYSHSVWTVTAVSKQETSPLSLLSTSKVSACSLGAEKVTVCQRICRYKIVRYKLCIFAGCWSTVPWPPATSTTRERWCRQGWTYLSLSLKGRGVITS